MPPSAKRTLAVDGRLHHKIPEAADDRSFCMFWAVPRTAIKKEANLVLEWAGVELSVKINLPSKTDISDNTTEGEVKVPVLTNPAAIAANTMLLAIEDIALHKVMASQNQKELAKAEKEKAKAAKKK